MTQMDISLTSQFQARKLLNSGFLFLFLITCAMSSYTQSNECICILKFNNNKDLIIEAQESKIRKSKLRRIKYIEVKCQGGDVLKFTMVPIARLRDGEFVHSGGVGSDILVALIQSVNYERLFIESIYILKNNTIVKSSNNFEIILK